VSINDDTDYHIFMLIHIISVEFQPTMMVNIINLCSDFELSQLGCFSNGAVLHDQSTQELDAVSIENLEFTPFLASFEGSVMCELRRKYAESDDKSELISTLVFVGWKSEGYKNFRAFVQLIECDKTFHWESFELREYYQRYVNQLCAYTDLVKDTWLIDDGTALATELELDFTQRDGVLNIIVSEQAERGEKGTEEVEVDHTKRLVCIGPER
jgi:hypothetical protein